MKRADYPSRRRRLVSQHHAYRSYGLTISSEIEIPELAPCAQHEAFPQVDVRIHLGRVDATEFVQGTQISPYLWVDRQQLSLHVPDIARFLVRRGSEIIVEPCAGIDEDSVRTFLLGSVMGALLLQRGMLVLHGSAIRASEQCVICCGPSGAGKSTLAAGFAKRGYDLLADDVVPVNDGHALPGPPRLKLWQDVADHLGIDTSTLPRIRPGHAKFSYALNRQIAARSYPVRWIYLLETHNRPDIRVTPITGMDRLQPLFGNIYRRSYASGIDSQAAHLQSCASLSSRARLCRLQRPDKGFDLEALIDRILADMTEHA